jgi:hypothetical protein
LEEEDQGREGGLCLTGRRLSIFMRIAF